MVAGLQVISDSNTLQIDENYSNLRVAHQGTLNVIVRNTVVNDPNSGASLTVIGNTPMLFFGANTSNTAFIVASRTRSGNSWTFTVYAKSQTLTDGSVASVPYCIFDSMPVTSPGTFGLQVYNDNGTLAFDSSNKYLRISGVFQPTEGMLSTPLPSPTSFAMVDATWVYLQQISSSFSVLVGFGVNVSGSNATIQAVPVSNTAILFSPVPISRPMPRIVFADTFGF